VRDGVAHVHHDLHRARRRAQQVYHGDRSALSGEADVDLFPGELGAHVAHNFFDSIHAPFVGSLLETDPRPPGFSARRFLFRGPGRQCGEEPRGQGE
jgi:hypothetical protein